MVRKDCAFNRSIRHITIDESHNVLTSGIPGRYGEAPYRPSYGELDLFFRNLLLFHLSATITPFARKTIDIGAINVSQQGYVLWTAQQAKYLLCISGHRGLHQ